MKQVKNNINEAKRYLKNADDLLNKNTTIDDLGHYQDAKYVKMS